MERRSDEPKTVHRCGVHRSYFLSCGFGYFARFNTTGANLHALSASLWELHANGLQVRVEAAMRAIVRMRDVVTGLRRFATDFAAFSHDYLIPPGKKTRGRFLLSVAFESTKRMQNKNL